MLPAAQHELLLISDSNVCAPPEYVRDMVSVLASEEGVGLVTNIFAGTGEDTLGAALENVQLNGFCASGTTLPTLLGDSLVVGKSMLLRRSEFERIGGFERVANVLAEDFVMGKMYQHAGLAVRIAPTILMNTTSNMTVQAYMKRHLRWCMLRWHLRPFAYALEPLTSPLFLLPVATFALGYAGLLWVVGLLAVRDLGGWLLLRGLRRAWLPVLLSVVRELTMLCIWICAPLKRHVEWRGHRARLGAGTLLFESR
jgi:ceramide glucosyltransferase